MLTAPNACNFHVGCREFSCCYEHRGSEEIACGRADVTLSVCLMISRREVKTTTLIASSYANIKSANVLSKPRCVLIISCEEAYSSWTHEVCVYEVH